MVATGLINVSKVLLNVNNCCDCIFSATCESLIDNYQNTICQVLENEMEVVEND